MKSTDALSMSSNGSWKVLRRSIAEQVRVIGASGRTGMFLWRQLKRGDLSNKVTGEGLIAKDSTYVG